jgi:hypothetical protein
MVLSVLQYNISIQLVYILSSTGSMIFERYETVGVNKPVFVWDFVTFEHSSCGSFV